MADPASVQAAVPKINRVIAITGGRADWSRGWGKAPFCGGKAHYFIEDTEHKKNAPDTHYWESACGTRAVTHDRAPMFEPGSWPRCKRCERWRAGPTVSHT